MKKLQIIEIDSALETQAIRATAEAWGFGVSTTWVGNSQQFVDVLSNGCEVDIVVLSVHGREGDILLPELDPEIQGSFPFVNSINAVELASFLRVNCDLMICTGCSLGNKEMAEVVLNGGAHSFVGPGDYPEGDAALKMCLDLLYLVGPLGVAVDNLEPRWMATNSSKEFGFWPQIQ